MQRTCFMTTSNRIEFVLRDRLVELLTDTEVSRVSKAETAVHLTKGEEFIDLEKLGEGVRRSDGVNTHTGNVLTRDAVEVNTWTKILALLERTQITHPVL